MTDGTYVGTRPASPIPEDLVSSAAKALDVRATIDEAVAGLAALPSRIFLVGSGGSYIGLVPLQYLLDTESQIPTLRMNSDEFFYREPATVGPGTLVVALSGAGSTRETVRAATWAQEQGADVFAITLKPESALGSAFTSVFSPAPEPGGFRSQLGGLAASQIIQQMVGLAILACEGHDTDARHAALAVMPQQVLTALEEFEPQAARIAADLKSLQMTYLLASGPLYGAATTFTMCFMQEMQWMNAATINANEFFQGPFEVIDKESTTVVFLGEDQTRPMGERAQRFLDTYGGTTHYVDARDFALDDVPASERNFVLPIVFHSLTTRIAAHLSAATGYELDGRRYMWKVDY